MAADSNAVAQEKAFAALVVYVERAGDARE